MQPNKTIPQWDKYFMMMADLAAKRSNCLRRSVGAILVKNKQVIATGYNGPPAGTPSCAEKGGCLREKLNVPSGERHELCRAVHAEVNTIAQAALHGINTHDSVLYCQTFPCSLCMKVLINAGVKKIIYKEEYNDQLSKELASEAGIELIKYEESRDKDILVSDNPKNKQGEDDADAKEKIE